jgi:hypothetical protein
VRRWRSSGQTALEFAAQEGLSVGSLRGWSSRLGRVTRAEHGASAIEPIELAVTSAAREAWVGAGVEIAVGEATVRCEVGADVTYVASLVRALSVR